MRASTRFVGGILLPCLLASFTVGCGSSSRVAAVSSGVDLPEFSDRFAVAEAQLNDFTSSTQTNVALDLLPDGGGIVAVWDSRRQQHGHYGIYGRLLSARGEPLTGEVRINDYIFGHQTSPAVTVSDDGTIWFAWTTSEHSEPGGAIIARRFDRNLTPLSGDIIVSDSEVGAQSRPTIETNARGDVLIAWSAQSDDEVHTSIRARILSSADAVPRGPERRYGGGFDGWDDLPVIARGADDGFILAFARRAADVRAARQGGETMPYAILAQRLDSDAQPIGEMITASPLDGGEHIEPAIASDSHGRFAIAWMASHGGEHHVLVRRFDASGAALGEAQPITEPDRGWTSGVALAMTTDGRTLIMWNHESNEPEPADGDGLGIMAAVLDAEGRRDIATPFIINAHRAGDQSMQQASNANRLAWNAEHGVIAVGWSGDAGRGDSSAAAVTVLHHHDVPGASPTIRIVQRDDRFADDASQPALARADFADSISEIPVPPIRQRRFRLPPIHEEDGSGPDFGFLGFNFTGWTPPDPELAVSPDHLVLIVNGGIAAMDKQGTMLWQEDISGGDGFWGSVGATNFVFDPECFWDPHHDRFWAMACERGSDNRSYFLLAVSATEDPSGAWHKWRIHRAVANNIDSPNFSVDEDIVYLSADYFSPDRYEVVMLEKAPLLNGSAITSETTVLFSGAGNQSMGMPIFYDTNVPAYYIIQSSEGTNNGLGFDEVRFHAIRNQMTNPTVTSIDINVPEYSYPARPHQAGTTVRPILFEPRFWSCTYVNGSLWAVHHVNSTRSRARWYEFEMNGWPESGLNPTLRQWGEIDPDPGTGVATFFPSIAADAQGNAVIFFSRSSSSEFISIGRAFRRHTDPLGTFRPMEFVKQSTSPYTAASRWGDYSHVAEDPSEPHVFWGHHQWTDVSNAWRTWVARVDTRPAAATPLGLAVVHGSHISGTADDLAASDGNEVVAQSAFGFSATEPNLLRINIDYAWSHGPAASWRVSVNSRLNNPGGTAKLRLFRWGGGVFEQHDEWAVGTENTTNATDIADTAPFIDTGGEVLAQLQYSVVATFAASGFEAFIDEASIVLMD